MALSLGGIRAESVGLAQLHPLLETKWAFFHQMPILHGGCSVDFDVDQSFF